VQRLDEIYNEKVQLVAGEVEASRARSAQLKEEVKRFDKLIETLSRNKQRALDHMKELVSSSQGLINQQATEKLTVLQSWSSFVFVSPPFLSREISNNKNNSPAKNHQGVWRDS